MTEEQAQGHRRNRLIIYVGLFVFIVLGLLFPMALKDLIGVEAQASYAMIERLSERGRAVVVMDTAGADAQRQLSVLLRHLLTRAASVIVISSGPEAAAVAESQVRAVLAAQRLRYGDDALHLGARPGGRLWVENAARGFESAAQGHDHAGDDLSMHPITYGFRILDDADVLVVVTDGRTIPVVDAYRISTSHGVSLLLAVTGEAVEEGRSLWSEGRIQGVLSGPKATADYEGLVAGRGMASRYFTAMTVATFFIIGLILWAYLGGLFRRRRRAIIGGIERR